MKNSEKFRLLEKILAGVIIFLICALVAQGVTGKNGFITYMELKRNHKNMGRQIEEIKADNERLSNEIRALRNDPGTLEGIAREELGMIKPGEILYQVRQSEETQDNGK